MMFQDEDAVFCPDMISSHFLHAYIVVRPTSRDTYHIRRGCWHDLLINCQIEFRNREHQRLSL